MVTVLLLTVAGHLGSSLTHGEDYLTSALPGNHTAYDNSKGVALLAELKNSDSISDAQQDELNLEVRAIFAHNCYQCHSENKQKGELVLENKAGVFKGGESGVVVVAGKPAESELYKRISLSPNDDDVMPKKGKVLKDTEIALVKLWIKNGAHWSDQPLKVFPEAELALVKPELPESGKELHPVDRLMDKGAIIRSYKSADLGHILHTHHQYHWHTCYEPPQSVQAPHIGAWIAKELGPANTVIPPFIAMGQRFTVGEAEELKAFHSAVFLGTEYGPFLIPDPSGGLESVRPPQGMSIKRFEARHKLYKELAHTSKLMENGSDYQRESLMRSISLSGINWDAETRTVRLPDFVS